MNDFDSTTTNGSVDSMGLDGDDAGNGLLDQAARNGGAASNGNGSAGASRTTARRPARQRPTTAAADRQSAARAPAKSSARKTTAKQPTAKPASSGTRARRTPATARPPADTDVAEAAEAPVTTAPRRRTRAAAAGETAVPTVAGDALTSDEIAQAFERPSGRTGPGSRWKTAAIVVSVVAVILAALLVVEWRKASDQSSTNSLRASAVRAATTYGGYLSSYDYRNLNGPTAAWTLVKQHATPKFESDFNQTSGTLAKLLTQYHATATGHVIAAGVTSVSSSRAVVLLFVDQTVTNTVQRPSAVTQPLRVQLTMVRQHGTWLIDNLEVPK